MSNRPNLFDYATKELSQDAFICWLLDWANPEYKEVDGELHECGKNLIKTLIQKHEKTSPDIQQVELKKQFKSIDVLALINNESYALLIEDKTDTVNHSGQLTRYYDLVKKKYPKSLIIPVYFKTGDQCSYKEVRDKGYILFLREDFLKVLNACQSDNLIFRDYLNHLQTLQNKVESYTSLKPELWSEKWYPWIGFFKALKKELDTDQYKCGWGYVPNQQGGFMGFWWHFLGEQEDYKIYLLLEEKSLCFKVYVKEKNDRAKLRSFWHNIIMELGEKEGLALKKPKRFGSGANMKVCSLEDYIKTKSDGTVDMVKTVEVLKSAVDLLEEAYKRA